MAVRRSGRGPDVVLFHGGMGSWKHWTRNIGPLAERFTVHALDHPGYGASAPVPRETSGPDYLDLVHRLFDPVIARSARRTAARAVTGHRIADPQIERHRGPAGVACLQQALQDLSPQWFVIVDSNRALVAVQALEVRSADVGRQPA